MSFLTISILMINLVPSQKGVIRNKSRVICDGSIDNAACVNATILCPDGFDCEIICNAPDIYNDARNSDCPSQTYGCCLTHIYCPSDHKCDILCNGGGCVQTHIHATNSSHLGIHGCTLSTSRSSCHDMSIFCPLRDDTSCIFEGDYTLQRSYIHTLRGFTNIYIEPTLIFDSCVLYCGATGREHHCTTNNQATECLDGGDITTCVYNDYNNNRQLNQHISTYFDTRNKTQIIAYVAVGIWLVIPLLITIIALIYHLTQTGSDSPQYLSLFKSCVNIADFYTDIIFCVFLLKQNSNLYVVAMICTALPHIISVVVCMVYMHRWSHNIYKIAYIKRHDSLVIALTVLIGFVPTIQLLSSKLFYASRLTLPICLAERVRIQQFKFMNHNLFEDIPLLIIQILIAFDFNANVAQNNRMGCILWIALMFSSLSILIGTAALILNCGYYQHKRHYVKTYELDIKSNGIESRHYYCHRLLTQCLCRCLKTEDGRIETVSVIPIVDGISCRIEIQYDELDEINAIDAMFKDIADNQTASFHDFQTVLCKRLHIAECVDLNVMISRLDLDGLDGNITKLKGRNTLYIPLKRRSIDGTNSMDLRKETITMRLSASSPTSDVIEEEMPLKQKSLLLETMRSARINTSDTLTSANIDRIKMTRKEDALDIESVDRLNETQTNTESAIRNGCIVGEIERKNVKRRNGNNHSIQGKHSTNYESELLSYCES